MISGKLRGVPHEVLMEEGNVWPTLDKMIIEHEIDLVVVGTHGRGKVQKILIGSVAEEIFRQAKSAVLTVGPAVKGGRRRRSSSITSCLPRISGQVRKKRQLTHFRWRKSTMRASRCCT